MIMIITTLDNNWNMIILMIIMMIQTRLDVWHLPGITLSNMFQHGHEMIDGECDSSLIIILMINIIMIAMIILIITMIMITSKKRCKAFRPSL